MTDRTLKAKVSKLQELQAEIDFLTGQAETIKDHIKEEMTARETDELKAGDAVIRWKYIRQNKFDSKAFKAAHASLYSKYTQEQETRRFTLVSA